jgi:hypothetical protein
MYTGAVVRVRVLSFVMALVVAAAPLSPAVCGLECGVPPAKATACHETGTTPHAATLQAGDHPCSHGEGRTPAVANASLRTFNAVSLAAQSSVWAAVPGVRSRPEAARWHDPPGPGRHRILSLSTILRI